MQEGAFRELPALRRTRTRTIAQSQDFAQGKRPSMALQFHNIFLRIRMRRTHHEADRLVDEAPILTHDRAVKKTALSRIRKLPAACGTKHARCRLHGRRTRKAHDADSTFSRCRSNGADRICLLQFVHPPQGKKKAVARCNSLIQINAQ